MTVYSDTHVYKYLVSWFTFSQLFVQMFECMTNYNCICTRHAYQWCYVMLTDTWDLTKKNAWSLLRLKTILCQLVKVSGDWNIIYNLDDIYVLAKVFLSYHSHKKQAFESFRNQFSAVGYIYEIATRVSHCPAEDSYLHWPTFSMSLSLSSPIGRVKYQDTFVWHVFTY